MFALFEKKTVIDNIRTLGPALAMLLAAQYIAQMVVIL